MPVYLYSIRVQLLFCFIALHFFSKAQVFYPKDSTFINTVSHQEKTNQQNFGLSKIDTVINHYQNYYPRNTNGNLGLPSAPLYLNYQAKELGFNLYQAPYDNDIIKNENVKYYQTKGPYADLTGIAGSRQEQMFKLLFSNTFKNKLNLTLAFNRYSGLGFYQRQTSFTNNFYTSSNYSNKNNRIGYYAFFSFNKVKHSENGGIKDDSLLLENSTTQKLLLPINLSNARREVRYSNVSFNPWFRLNKTEDSSKTLSHYVDYQFDYAGNYTKYFDDRLTTDTFYHVFYIDEFTTNDSTYWRTFSNSLNYTLKINPIRTKFKLGYKNEYNQVYQYLDSVFSNDIVNAGLYTSEKNNSSYIKASYIVNGANAGDYSLELNSKLFKDLKIGSIAQRCFFNIKANLEKRHPDFIYNTWYSNHFAWNNSFVPTEKMQAQASIGTSNNRFEMGGLFQSVKNFIYFDEQAIPQQTPIEIQNLVLFVKKDLLLFKHLGINLGYNYQSSSYPAIVSVPQHVANGALYYQGNLFKKALQLQVGFSGQYFSEFYGYAYMPATNMYYVQTQKIVAGYPFVDFFISARIKPVRFFIKIDHVNQGFMGSKYQLTPGYYQNDRAFKFGLNWLFFD